jgi:hypothetical protein
MTQLSAAAFAVDNQARLSRSWAENALGHVAAQKTVRALSEWIAVNGVQLGLADAYAHDAWVKVRLAIGDRFGALGA